MDSNVRYASNLTVLQLKEKLKELGLPCTGNKNELVIRLNASTPSGTWTEPRTIESTDEDEAAGADMNERRRSTDEATGADMNERGDSEEELRSDSRPCDVRVFEMELNALRREIEQLRIQRRSDVRVPNAHVDVESRLMQPRININSIAELLVIFDGTTNNFEIWERQLRQLRRTYRLDEEHTRVLIGMRLKGKAYEWLHSRSELAEISVEALICELKAMFDHRPSRIMLRKKFEERMWKKGETFSDYMHQKIILGNHVPVDEEEIIDYIIDGIPDVRLRDQARISSFKTKRSLLEAFENVMLWEKKHPGVRGDGTKEKVQHQKSAKSGKDERKEASADDKRRCFNCGLPDHLGKDCPTKENGPKCFKCGERGHIASKCLGKREDVKSSYVVTQVTQTKCNKEVAINGCNIVALVDTGSDLCLMRADQYVDLGSPPLECKNTRFTGVGLKENETLGEFHTELTVDGRSYPILIRVVANDVINFKLLIGIDFLNTVELRIKNGNVLISPLAETIVEKLPEIFQIDLKCEKTDEVDVSHVVNCEHRSALEKIVSSYSPVKVRETNIKMSIILKDEEPVYQRARRLSTTEKEKVNEHINDWIRDGIIQPSLSDYASPVVLVAKKDGNTRLCVDYRQLNKKIVRDRYPLPLIEDQLDLLQDAKYFSTLDLKNGFFHVPMDKDSIKYTAFIVPDGQYEFLKVPFGLCNSPSVFQRFINDIFRNAIRKKKVLTYLDDLIIPSKDEETGIMNLKIILEIASEAGLIINWRKCCFLQSRIDFLGYVIENGRVYPSTRKIEAVRKFPEPISVKQVQSFLGLSGYFRKFVPKYSIIARPLTNLLKSNVKFYFGEEEKRAFTSLKDILCDHPVLHLYRVNAITELHTDASIDGYGAILLQKSDEDGALHPIYYSSGKTTLAERRYTSYELEVLAIVRALKKFRVYLLGISFKIVTDCRAFALTMHKKDLCVRVARWALLLEEFDYVIEHRPGKSMMHVDALSRNPLPICMVVNERDSLTVKFKRAQQDDSDVKKMFDAVKEEKLNGYTIKNDLLFKEHNGDLLLVVPKLMRTQIVKQAHERGHFSVAKTEAFLCKDYYIPNVRSKIEKVVRNCVTCILAERKQGKQEGYLNTIEKGELPLDTYHVDHLGPLPSTRKNYKHVFLVVDAFTKFTWLYATKTTNATEVLSKLKKQAIIFGNPRRIVSDRGAAFTSKEFAEYCAEEKIRHILTTTGVPRANGQVERVNRVLIPLLTKLSDKREEWFKFLDVSQLCLNCTSHRSIGTSPFHLMFGTHPRVRNDPQIRELLEAEWVNDFQNERNDLREQAKECIAKVQRENRVTFAKKRKAATKYGENDLVAIKRTQLGPGLKLANKYFGPYVVTRVLRNDRYLVQKVGEHEGPMRTSTSADHMKPWVECMSDDSEEEEEA